MVELQHRSIEPPELIAFRAEYPEATPNDFDSPAFRVTKASCKTALHQDQGGLCAYCEKFLTQSDGQIDHIKPKSGNNAYPHLCFTYSNYAHSCINPNTCGQKKKNGLLPIEPGPGCNREWTLSGSGTVVPLLAITKARRHAVRQTCDMLGLNTDTNLADERKKWLDQVVDVMQKAPHDIQLFLQKAPFRHLLTTVC